MKPPTSKELTRALALYFVHTRRQIDWPGARRRAAVILANKEGDK